MTCLTCGGCRHWLKVMAVEPQPIGVCKRYPPTPQPGAGALQKLPQTSAADWCGEAQAPEAA